MNKQYKVIYSPAAKDDLHDSSAYLVYQLKAPQAAKNLTARIRKEIRSLSTMPERYALVEWEPWASMGMRKVPVGSFVVFYRVDHAASVVTVTRIIYGGRDIARMIQEADGTLVEG